MKKIPLSQGKFALVDDDDFEWLNQWKWRLDLKSGYVVRNIRVEKKIPRIYMHRLILNPPKGLYTDHINHNKLDNRRDNLRVCTTSQNGANRLKQTKKSLSRFKGVTWHKRDSVWQSTIKHKGKNIFIGYFNDEITAAKKYNVVAKKIFGEYAYLNDL
jgi:hypothetical protein